MKRLFLLLPILTVSSLCAQDNGIDQSLDLVNLPTGEKAIWWIGKPGRSYFIQVSDENDPLAKWTWAPLIEGGNGEEISHEVGGTADKGFFRLQYTDQVPGAGETLDTADFDGDSLSNLAEIAPPAPLSATNPLNPDSDGDGLTDGWERSHGLDPNDATGNNGASGDPDGDDLTNIEEQNAGANPHAIDTDGDGLSDKEEAALGTNPNSQDSDGDGVLDPMDGYALTAGLSPPRVAETRYAVIDLHDLGFPQNAYPHFLDGKGNVFYATAEFGFRYFEVASQTSTPVIEQAVVYTLYPDLCFSDGGWVGWTIYDMGLPSAVPGIFRWSKQTGTQSMAPEYFDVPSASRTWPIFSPGPVINDLGALSGVVTSSGNETDPIQIITSSSTFLWPPGTNEASLIGQIHTMEGGQNPAWDCLQPNAISSNPLVITGLVTNANSSTVAYEAYTNGALQSMTSFAGYGYSPSGLMLTPDGGMACFAGENGMKFARSDEGWQVRPIVVWDQSNSTAISDFSGITSTSRGGGIHERWEMLVWRDNGYNLLRNGRLVPLDELVPEGEVVGNPVCLNSQGAILTDTGKLLLPVEVAFILPDDVTWENTMNEEQVVLRNESARIRIRITGAEMSLSDLEQKGISEILLKTSITSAGFPDKVLSFRDPVCTIISGNNRTEIRILLDLNALKRLNLLPSDEIDDRSTHATLDYVDGPLSNLSDSQAFLDGLATFFGPPAGYANEKAGVSLSSNPPQSKPHKTFLEAAGAEVLEVKYQGVRKLGMVMNQGELFYFSGHGFSGTRALGPNLLIGDGVAVDSVDLRNYWNEDLHIVLIAGCSVVNINNLNPNPAFYPATIGPDAGYYPGEFMNTVGPIHIRLRKQCATRCSKLRFNRRFVHGRLSNGS